MIKTIKLLALLGVLFLSSCKRQRIKKSILNPDKPTTETSEGQPTNKNAFNISEANFDYLKIKTKVNIESESLTEKIPANIQIKKDSLIWISVSVGLEAARAIINQDSIIILNRINKEYYKLSFQELSERLSFPVTYSLVQSLVTGNLPFAIKKDAIVLEDESGVSANQAVSNLNIISKIKPPLNKLVAIFAEDEKNNAEMNISYTDFEDQTGQYFPLNISSNIIVKKSSNLNVVKFEFNHNKLEVSDKPLKMPFSIPDSYTENQLAF